MALFFGYGANRNRSLLSRLFGHELEKELGAIIEGYQLAYQNLEQIPDVPQQIIRERYGNEYRTYTLQKGEGVVSGALFELTDQDIEVLKEWEFVGVWREMITVDVRLANGHVVQAVTEKAIEGSPIEKVIDGLLYDEFAHSEKEEVDKEQLERMNQRQIKAINDWLQGEAYATS